jgi:hypothetical protein
MNAKWTSRIGAGTILAVLSTQAMAQPWGGGAGRGQGFGPGQGRGMGWRAEGPGPMRREIGPGGPQGGPQAWCPWGTGPRGQGYGRGRGMGMGWRADRPGYMRQGMGPGGPQRGSGAWGSWGAGPGMGIGRGAGRPGYMRQGMGPGRLQGGPGAWRPWGAGQRGGGLRAAPGQGQAGLGPLFARRLNLTDDQVKQIQDILAKSRTETRAAIKEVLTDEQVQQLEQMRDRAAQRGRGLRGPAWQDRPAGPAGGRVEPDAQRPFGPRPPSNRGQDGRDTDVQRGQGRGAGMGPRGQGPAGQPFAGGRGPGRGMQRQGDPNRPDAATQPPASVRGTNPAAPWNLGVPPLEQMFDEADTDKDGALTREEIRAFHRARGAGPGWQRQ